MRSVDKDQDWDQLNIVMEDQQRPDDHEPLRFRTVLNSPKGQDLDLARNHRLG